jgi:hypothetical protein
MTHTPHHIDIKPPYTAAELGLQADALRYESIDPQIPQNDRQHYQRHIDESRVQHSVAQGVAEIAQRIGLLGYRSDGSYWIIDGQHHTEAAIRLGITVLGYWVFDSIGPEYEKGVFNRFAFWKAEQAK